MKISKGRREEFRHFRAFQDESSRSSIPDPQAEETFLRSKLDWSERDRPERKALLALYRAMLALRRDDPVLRNATRSSLECAALGDQLLVVKRSHANEKRTLVVNFAEQPAVIDSLANARCWVKSSPDAWAHGTLAGESAALFGG